MTSRLWKTLVAVAATAVCVMSIATPSGRADTNQIVTGPWGGPTAQGQRIDFTVNPGVPMTVDPISFGANLNCPTRPDFSVGHGFFGFATPIDANNQFTLDFGPDQGSTFSLTKVGGTFTSDTTAEGKLVEVWAVIVTKKLAEACTSEAVSWTATPGGITDAEIAKYDRYYTHTKGPDGKVTTIQVK
jgi:hypothetical protein